MKNIHLVWQVIFIQLGETSVLPCLQRFLSGKSFSMYEVARVSSISHSQPVYLPERNVNRLTTRNTRDAKDFVQVKGLARKKPLLAGYLGTKKTLQIPLLTIPPLPLISQLMKPKVDKKNYSHVLRTKRDISVLYLVILETMKD